MVTPAADHIKEYRYGALETWLVCMVGYLSGVIRLWGNDSNINWYVMGCVRWLEENSRAAPLPEIRKAFL